MFAVATVRVTISMLHIANMSLILGRNFPSILSEDGWSWCVEESKDLRLRVVVGCWALWLGPLHFYMLSMGALYRCKYLSLYIVRTSANYQGQERRQCQTTSQTSIMRKLVMPYPPLRFVGSSQYLLSEGNIISGRTIYERFGAPYNLIVFGGYQCRDGCL